MISFAYALLFLLFFHVCYTDIRDRLIKNHTTLFIGILSTFIAWLSAGEISLVPAVTILLVGFSLSAVNVTGAGDVKLLAALSLSLQGDVTLIFLFLTSLAGLPVALASLLVRKYFRHHPAKRGQVTVPYGVAIVCGYLATVILLRGTA